MKKLQNNFTTTEQSKRLLELGVPKDSADCLLDNEWLEIDEDDVPSVIHKTHKFTDYDQQNYTPCWSVGRLIEIHLKCCTTLNQNDAIIVISNFGIETVGLLQYIYDMVCELALLGKYDFSKLEE